MSDGRTRCPIFHRANWELLAPNPTHKQTWGGSRPLSQLRPLSLMSPNDSNIPRCHNLANRCQFSVTARPIGYLPELWPGDNDDVQFNISFNLQVQFYSKVFEDDILIYIWKWALTFYLVAKWSKMSEGSEPKSGNMDVYAMYIPLDFRISRSTRLDLAWK